VRARCAVSGRSKSALCSFREEQDRESRRSTWGWIRGDGRAVVDHGPPWGSMRGAYEYDVFISHAWDKDDEGRDNHARAKRLNEGLQKLKVKTWFDNEQMQGNILQRMAEGIERSAVVLICVSRTYMEKVAQDGSNNCKLEFEYAHRKRTPLCMLPIVMEKTMTNTASWVGVLGLLLGSYLYCPLTSDIDADFDCAVANIAQSVDKLLQKALPNEMQSAASAMSARSHSPTPTDMSYVSTAPATPQSPPLQEVVAMHVENTVHEFKDDMKKLIEGFLKPPSSEAADQPALRRWRLCELLLVAFMRNEVAPSCDLEAAENLKAWEGKCEDPHENIVESFHEIISFMRPPLFKDLKYEFAESPRNNHISVFVIDWMFQHSSWSKGIPPFTINEWTKKVVMKWLDDGNTEDAEAFLERAETFLQKCVKGESWGAKILGNVIRTNSYVIFFRMEALAALLLREHCALQMKQHTQRQMQQDPLEPAACALSLPPISLIVSSSNWHLSVQAQGNDGSEAHIADVTRRLQRIASLPAQVLEANACFLSKIESVEWDPLCDLIRGKMEQTHADGGQGASASEYVLADLIVRSETLAAQIEDSTALRAPPESAFFQVALYVAVVGKGVLDPSTPSRVLERLQKASSKVPTEQIIRISLRDKVAVKGASETSKEGKEVELKLRVFVANSEDAKAVQGYIASHDEQVPAPVVVLCPMLPMAMEYDALTVDPTNQGTADRLIKQAKTRAVKLVRELLMENTDKLSSEILFGYEGPSAPVQHLAESLKKRTSVINPETKERGIVYTAGCKPVSAASSAGPAYVSAKAPAVRPVPRPEKKSKVRYGVRACIGLGLRI
jgi:hypothetical protein